MSDLCNISFANSPAPRQLSKRGREVMEVSHCKHCKYICSCYIFLGIHYSIGRNWLFAQDIALLKMHRNSDLTLLYALP